MNNNGNDLEEFTAPTSNNSTKEKTKSNSVSGIRPVSNADSEYFGSPKDSIISEGGENPVEPTELSNKNIVEPGTKSNNKPIERKITDVDEDGVDDVQELMDKMKLFSANDYDEKEVDVSKIKKRVRRREKKKVLQFRMFSRLAIALIVFGTVVLILTVIYLIYINMSTKNGSTVPMGKVIQVKNSVNHYSLVVTEAETNITVSRIGSGNYYSNNNNTTNNSNNNNNYNNYNTTTVSSTEQFTRVKLQIKNNKGTPSPVVLG